MVAVGAGRSKAPRGGLVALVLAAACCAPGCAYAEARAADLADIGLLELSAGYGAHVGVQLTDFVGTGIGYSEQWALAWHGREVGTLHRSSAGIVTIFLSFSEPERHAMSTWVGAAPRADASAEVGEQANCLFVPMDWWFGSRHAGPGHDPGFELAPRGIRSFDVTLGASLMLGVHVGVSLGDLLDFVLGWTGLDIAGDDVPADERTRDDWFAAPAREPAQNV
ncbi:MAG: hypothetical protein H6825_09970 [Planctomycetes bacterium]|nr:hypothetical protein [Planctomycetota bacterium]